MSFDSTQNTHVHQQPIAPKHCDDPRSHVNQSRAWRHMGWLGLRRQTRLLQTWPSASWKSMRRWINLPISASSTPGGNNRHWRARTASPETCVRCRRREIPRRRDVDCSPLEQSCRSKYPPYEPKRRSRRRLSTKLWRAVNRIENPIICALPLDAT